MPKMNDNYTYKIFKLWKSIVKKKIWKEARGKKNITYRETKVGITSELFWETIPYENYYLLPGTSTADRVNKCVDAIIDI